MYKKCAHLKKSPEDPRDIITRGLRTPLRNVVLTRSPATLQDVERYARLAHSLSLDTPAQPDVADFTKAIF